MPQILAASSAPARWSDAAIRDTIADIATGAEYQRELTTSLALRILNWLGDLLSSVRGTSVGRIITIALLVLLAAIIVARILIGVRAEQAMRATRKPRTAVVVDRTEFADAERLAQAGDFTAAAHALFAAVLRACAARGDVRLHPSKTTGDYARELRRRNSTSLPPFQSFRSRYDRVIYGDMQCSAADYAVLHTDAHHLLRTGGAA
jgi:hypothetical protein